MKELQINHAVSCFRLVRQGVLRAVLAAGATLTSADCSAQLTPVQVATGAYPDLTVDADANIHLIYIRDGSLRYRRLGAGAHDWSREEDTGLPQLGVERSDPEVVTDSLSRPHVLAGAGYAWRDGKGEWRKLNPGVVRDTALAIDSKDTVYVVRREGHDGGYVGLRALPAGAAQFEPRPDPDIANRLPLGRNNHVYAHVAVDPRDDSLHVIYRHGAPRRCAYRVSRDGGRTWIGGGVSDDDREAPSLAIAPSGAVYAVTGTGQVYQRTGAANEWQSLGRAVTAGSRDLPVIVVDVAGRVTVGCFGGRLNVARDGQFGVEWRLPAPHGGPLGFVDLAVSPRNGETFVAWEEGEAVHNDEPAGESHILFAQLSRPDSNASSRGGKTSPD